MLAHFDDLEARLETGLPEVALHGGRQPIAQQPARRRLGQAGRHDHERPGRGAHAGTAWVCDDPWVERRPRRHVRRSQRLELATQHRHDLGAQDVHLLEHGLQRQAAVIGDEQLTLVVAGELAEAERPVDDLLRAADGHRRLGHVVLERHRAAVDRGVIEVRPELADRVLAVLAHEHVPAESDDRLVRRSVAVVLEAAPVELDHPLHVAARPEDVVVEEAVAVERGLLGDLRAADGAVPDERRHAIERTRRRGEGGQRRPELTLPVHDVLAPQATEEVVVLDRERDRVAQVLAEPRVDRPHVAAAHHQVDPAVGQVLEHRVVLGDLDRVVGRDQRRRGRELQALGPGGDVAEQRGRGGWHERHVVVLAGREDVEADLLRLERHGHHDPDALFLADRVPGGRVGRDVAHREYAELHVVSRSSDGSPVVPATTDRDRIWVQYSRQVVAYATT